MKVAGDDDIDTPEELLSFVLWLPGCAYIPPAALLQKFSKVVGQNSSSVSYHNNISVPTININHIILRIQVCEVLLWGCM